MYLGMEEIDTRRDERGSVFEPLETDALPRQRNVHMVITRSGHIRGNHYHRRGMEVIVVWGETLVRIRDLEGIRDIRV